jgi:hypothetical protein
LQYSRQKPSLEHPYWPAHCVLLKQLSPARPVPSAVQPVADPVQSHFMPAPGQSVSATGSHGMGTHAVPDVLHMVPEPHEPHEPPQPFAPHTRPLHIGVQIPQWFAMPAPAHVSGSVHMPQLGVRETAQRSVTVNDPQSAPRAVQSSALVSATQPH